MNPSASLYNAEGQVVGTCELSPKLFAVAPKDALLHQVMVAQGVNRRIVHASTKDRSEVSGGGRKPWKQKGTGRARQGSIRAPQWKGGGVVFGPTTKRVFSAKINRKMFRKALAMSLTDALQNDRFVVVDAYMSGAKTKNISSMLKALPHAKEKSLILVETENTEVGRAARNMKQARILPANCLNVESVLEAGRVVASKRALEIMEQLYAKTA